MRRGPCWVAAQCGQEKLWEMMAQLALLHRAVFQKAVQ